jgi:hypothetical protein
MRFNARLAHTAAARLSSALPSKGAADVPGQIASSRFSRGTVTHSDCPRPEFIAVHKFKLDVLVQTGEQPRPVSGEDWLH